MMGKNIVSMAFSTDIMPVELITLAVPLRGGLNHTSIILYENTVTATGRNND